MDKLKGSQKKYLRAQAHHLKPLVIIGAKGVTDHLIGSVDLALKDHELIKVKFGEFKESKKKSPQKSPRRQKANLPASSAISPFSIVRIPHRKKEKLKYLKQHFNFDDNEYKIFYFLKSL